MTYIFDKPTLYRQVLSNGLNEKMFSAYIKPKKKLTEAFESLQNLQAKLNEKMIKIMNESSGGSVSKWSLSSKWTDAWNNARSPKEANALIEIFIQIACPSWGCKLENLDPGKDIIIKIIDELGFKDNENPYLDFIKTFYKVNGTDVTLSEDDWVKLNDWYAADLIEADDLKGTGFDGAHHIIFNKNLYKDGNISSDNDNYVKYFQLLSTKFNVMKLNIYAIATFNGSPYGSLAKMTKDGVNGTGVYQGGDFREVRNIIFYKDPSKPLGDLWKLYYVQKAYNIGIDTHYKAETDEIATGSTKADLKRDVSDTLKKVKTILKELEQKASDYIKNYSAKNPRATKRAQDMTNKVNQYLKDDVNNINKFIGEFKTVNNQTEYENVYKKLSDFINNKMKTKKYLKDISTLKSDGAGNRVKKQQNLTYDDIEQSFDGLSKRDLDSLIKLLKSKGIVK